MGCTGHIPINLNTYSPQRPDLILMFLRIQQWEIHHMSPKVYPELINNIFFFCWHPFILIELPYPTVGKYWKRKLFLFASYKSNPRNGTSVCNRTISPSAQLPTGSCERAVVSSLVYPTPARADFNQSIRGQPFQQGSCRKWAQSASLCCFLHSFSNQCPYWFAFFYFRL